LFADSPWNGAVVGLPLRRGDQVLGVMNLAYHVGPHNYDENELRVLDLLADQAAIALHNANLYNEARERAQELAAALAQREELDRLKDEFIQNVSHELRTPLAITRGYVELLDSGELGELSKNQFDAVNICKRRVNMLIKLVDDLVTILEAEASQAAREEINLTELVLGAAADFQDAADRAGLTLGACP
jgi:signal transduction histidine kinase